jgi:hypothetical protein
MEFQRRRTAFFFKFNFFFVTALAAETSERFVFSAGVFFFASMLTSCLILCMSSYYNCSQLTYADVCGRMRTYYRRGTLAWLRRRLSIFFFPIFFYCYRGTLGLAEEAFKRALARANIYIYIYI